MYDGMNFRYLNVLNVLLAGLSKAYKGCGWNVQFHTQTAVSDVDGEGSFFSDRNLDYFEWDGSIRGRTCVPNIGLGAGYLHNPAKKNIT